MALSAEIRSLLGVEMLERLRQCLEVVLSRIGHMLLRTSMAMLAIQSGNNLRWLKLFTGFDPGAVTIEAGAGLPYR